MSIFERFMEQFQEKLPYYRTARMTKPVGKVEENKKYPVPFQGKRECERRQKRGR